MTEKEAIRALKANMELPFGTYVPDEASEIAIQALEEIQRYRVIGTLEECRAAVDRMKPKKPIKTEMEGYRYTDTYRCPACGGNFSGTGIADFCYHCGQALEWKESEE